MTTKTKSEPTILVRSIGMSVSTCRGCPQKIIWVYSERGHLMPLNDGFQILELLPRDGVEWIRVRSADTHWANCIARESFKRKAASR